MPPPSPLVIATSSVQRLLKEETSYHKELAEQETQIKALQEQIQAGGADEDGNNSFMLKQQQMAVDQTKAVFKPLRERITAAMAKLEDQIAGAEDSDEAEKAKAVLAQAKAQA